MRYCCAVLMFLTFICHSIANAQNCDDNIVKANTLLKQGRLHECIQLARGCAGITVPENLRWQAFRLMSISYVAIGEKDSARKYAENMLDINPTYKSNPSYDSKEFAKLLYSVVIIPNFSLGMAVSVGSNLSFENVRAGYTVSDYQKTYTPENGYLIGTNLGVHINPNFIVEFGINQSKKNYNINYMFGGWEVNIQEKLTYLETPLSIRYAINPKSRINIYTSLGLYTGYLLYGSGDFRSENTIAAQTYELQKVSVASRRNKFNYGLIGGLRISYKLRNGNLFFATDYFYSLRTITKSSTRYDYPQLMFDYFYLDDEIRLNTLGLHVGYTYNLNYRVFKKGEK